MSQPIDRPATGAAPMPAPSSGRADICSALTAACGVADLAAETAATLGAANSFERMLSHQMAATHRLAMTSMAHTIRHADRLETSSSSDRYDTREARKHQLDLLGSMLEEFRTCHMHLLRSREMTARMRLADAPPQPAKGRAGKGDPA